MISKWKRDLIDLNFTYQYEGTDGEGGLGASNDASASMGGDSNSGGGGSSLGSHQDTEDALGIGETNSIGHGPGGGYTSGPTDQDQADPDSYGGGYSVSHNEDGTATVFNAKTNESVTVKDGVAIEGSLEGFGTNPGDVSSAGLNEYGQFEVTRQEEDNTTTVETYAGEEEDIDSLLSTTTTTNIHGVPATITVDVKEGTTTMTSGGKTATIGSDGTVTGEEGMFSDTGGGFIDGVKAIAKTIHNKLGRWGTTALSTVFAGPLVGITTAAKYNEKDLSINEQRALSQMENISQSLQDGNMNEEQAASMLESVDNGDGMSMITGKPIDAGDAANTGVSTEGLQAGKDSEGNYAYDSTRFTPESVRTGDRTRGELIQEIYRNGLGKEPDVEGYKYWLQESDVSDEGLYDAIRNSAVNEYGASFNDFDVNQYTDTSRSELTMESTVDTAKAQLEVAQGQLNNFEEFFGNPLENYNQWFKRLDPYQAQALGQSEIKQSYQDINDKTIADFARRGITDSGILSSVMTNFDISEAESLAANRAQNMANYTSVAQNDAQIRLAEENQKFNQRDTLTQNQYSQANALNTAQTNLSSLQYESTQAEAARQFQAQQLDAQQELSYAGLNAQERESESRLALAQAELDAGISQANADRDAAETSDKWALGTTLLGGLLS